MKVLDLKILNEEIKRCKKCPLAEKRQKVVTGRGSARPKVLFIGEAPGKEEDKQGKPFVGKAGQLLNKWIKEIGLREEDYAIINVVKCIPLVGNRVRTPNLREISACREWTEKQIELLSPYLIVALGLVASQFLLEDFSLTMKEVENRVFDTKFGKVFCFRHPAYFLYKQKEADISLLKKEVERCL